MSHFKSPLARAFGLVIGYLASFWLVRLAYLTLVAYTFVRSPEKSSLQKIGDVVHANEVPTYGIAALVFAMALHIMHPLTRTQLGQLFGIHAFKERSLATNALGGLILATALTACSMLSGHMSYLGVYMKFDEVAFSVVTSMAFAALLTTMTIVEEYILRKALEPELERKVGPISVSVLSTAVYLLMKFLQFDLEWLTAMNLVLLNLMLSEVARAERTYMASACFCAVFLAVVHMFFGLPYMGQDMPGIFLLRSSNDAPLNSLLAGGSAGPEAGVVFTVLLIISISLRIRLRRDVPKS